MLPLADESVDVVINIESAAHYSDRRTFLSECFRILKRGGRMVAQDATAADGISEADHAAHIQPTCDAWFFKNMETRSSYMSKLREARLEIVDFVDVTEPMLPNAHLLAAFARQLLFKEMFCPLSEVERQWLEQCRTFSSAWLGGYLHLERYSCRKR